MADKKGQGQLCEALTSKAFENVKRCLWVVVPVIIRATDCNVKAIAGKENEVHSSTGSHLQQK